MARVLFISETTLKEQTVINENVDNKVVTPLIVECQDLYILPLIGTGIFEELKTQITAGTVTADNTNLLDNYIVPCLCAYIKYEAPIELNYKFTNKNVSKKNSENSQAISPEEINDLMNRFKNKAEVYGQRLTNFLKANTETYPLYLNPGTGCDIIKPASSAYSCGIYLE
jgi:hypothetical protein